MSFCKWIGFLLLGLGCSWSAQAQIGVYAGYTGQRLSGIQCLSIVAGYNDCSTNSTSLGVNQTKNTSDSVDPSGLFAGGYFDFRNVGPVRLGVDLRYINGHSNKSASSAAGGKGATTVDTGLVGVRGVFNTPISWLKPYGEVAVGYTSSDATEPPCQTGTGATLLCSGASTGGPRVFDSFVQYEAFVGADIRIASMLDLRAIELGIGNMNRFGNGTAGSTSSVGVMSVGVGVVLRFP
jgi:hypothetical protein